MRAAEMRMTAAMEMPAAAVKMSMAASAAAVSCESVDRRHGQTERDSANQRKVEFLHLPLLCLQRSERPIDAPPVRPNLEAPR